MQLELSSVTFTNVHFRQQSTSNHFGKSFLFLLYKFKILVTITSCFFTLSCDDWKIKSNQSISFFPRQFLWGSVSGKPSLHPSCHSPTHTHTHITLCLTNTHMYTHTQENPLSSISLPNTHIHHSLPCTHTHTSTLFSASSFAWFRTCGRGEEKPCVSPEPELTASQPQPQCLQVKQKLDVPLLPAFSHILALLSWPRMFWSVQFKSNSDM